MHSAKSRCVPPQYLRVGIEIDAEVAGSFFRIAGALRSAERSLDSDIAVSILDVAAMSNPPHDEHERSDTNNAKHDNHGDNNQNDLERVTLR